MQCSHGAENEDEEHGAENECGHAHGLADFAVREQQCFAVAAGLFKSVFNVVVHVDGVIDGDA